MQSRCQHCQETVKTTLGKYGGIFRCPACLKLNILLPAGTSGAMDFAEYRVLEEVGQGANAVVCRARQVETGEIFALKLFISDNTDEHSAKEFVRESAIAQEIVHKNVVRVYHCGEWHGIPYLVMEFVDGINMMQFVEQFGAMNQLEAMSLACHACSALDHVWSSFLMIHRDIKPQNIMLTKGGEVKICDFGMVTAHELAGVDLTAVEGTPYYLSPECITEGAYQDNRSDIYSLGATLYHLIAGVPPFDRDTVMEVLEARLKEPPPDIRKVAPKVTEDVANVLLTMMARAPEERYVTALECLEDIERIGRGEKPLLVDPHRSHSNA